jgi:2-amino-4-hydroxy-6-hydroxymethyldihydropteridine diphosphokinase
MPYLNAAMEINYIGEPVVLMGRLLELEKAMGRPSKRLRNAPRIIDLDILYMDNLVLNTPELVIPHSRLYQRRFVLAPLAEISPDLILRGQTSSVRTLLAQLDDPSEVTRLEVSLFDCG